MNKTIIVTGGAGFIGSHFVDLALKENLKVVVLDALTYAGNEENLASASKNPNYRFVKGDIGDFQLVSKLLAETQPTYVVNFAAESHVDNSITGPQSFIDTNILGTFHFLQANLSYWKSLKDEAKENYRYLQVSTDEVFGDLGEEGYFSETTPYNPHSPYSASKAGGDHLVRAWHDTYGLPTLITNCSNNYGPRQFPEKLIPLMIVKSLKGEKLPVYGEGSNIRDWIHVIDHCRGVWLALTHGKPGDTYCFGGNSERKNLDVVKSVCNILDELRPKSTTYSEQISFVTDRLGHDWRYAIDDSLAQKKLKYQRHYRSFEDGLLDTVKWYLDNNKWVENILGRQKK